MNMTMEVETWCGSHWNYDTYTVKLREEDLIYTIKRFDIMFIKGLGELQVNTVELEDLCVTIYCTYMGGFADGENKFAEAPWA